MSIEPRIVHIPCLVMLFAISVAGIVHAQDSVIHAPDCVRLGWDWGEDGYSVHDQGSPESLYEAVAGTVGDLDGDGIDEFMWRCQLTDGSSVSGSWVVNLSEKRYHRPHIEVGAGRQIPPDVFATGDFWGQGMKSLGVAMLKGWGPRWQVQFAVFRTDTSFEYTGATLLMSVDSIAGRPLWMSLRKAAAADLDGDGADELLILLDYASADSVIHNGDLWIFRGGPDFQLTTPRMMIHDVGSTFELRDLDGDAITDMVSADSARVMLWRGGADDMTRWVYPDRTVSRTVASSSAAGRLALLDCDGDGAKDIVFTIGEHPCLFRTGTGKSVWTRSFEEGDADLILPRVPVYAAVGHFCGSKQYESLALGDKELNILPGGPRGLSTISRAWYAARPPDSNLQVLDIRLTGDVNADGWDDLSCLVHLARSGNCGTALRSLGGPWYPDENGQSTGIDEGGEQGVQVRIWPQPAANWLHVTWGEALPAVVVLHDLLGHEVMRQGVGESQNGVLLSCGDLMPGTYLLSLYHHDGMLLRTMVFLKR